MRGNGSIVGANNALANFATKGIWSLQEVRVGRVNGKWPPGVGDGAFGNSSRYFDGSSWVEIPSMIDASGFSVALWAKWTTVGTSVTNMQALVDGSHNNTGGWVIQDFPQSSKKLGAGVIAATGTSINAQTSSQVGDGTWRHIVFTFDGSTCNIYVDGTIAATDTKSLTTNFRPGIYIGRTQTNFTSFGGTRPFTGYMSDLRFYDKVLSSEYCSSLAAGNSITDGLVSWFFTDNDDVLDYAGSTISVNNGTTYSTDGPFD